MAAKKKDTQSTEKTSPAKSMTVVELRVIFDRLRKKYNEGYDEETSPLNERINAVHKLTYLGDLLSANKGTDHLFIDNELDVIVQYIYEIAEYLFKENKSQIDSYFKYYESAIVGERNLILRLMDAGWSFNSIMAYINKIRSGEIPHRKPLFEALDEVDKEETCPVDDVDLYTYDEQRLIIRLTDNGWPDSRIKEYINKVRAGEILGMTASKLLEEMDKNKLRKSKHDDLVYARVKANEEKKDMVNHPPHYNVGGFEVIDIIKTFTEGLEGIKAVDTANAIKYILRWHRKNGVEDLKKAKWYIGHLIKEIENDSN